MAIQYGYLECHQGQGCKKCDNQFILINETAMSQQNKVLIDEKEDINEEIWLDLNPFWNPFIINETTIQKVTQNYASLRYYDLLHDWYIRIIITHRFIRSIIIIVLYQIYIVFISTSSDVILEYLYQSIRPVLRHFQIEELFKSLNDGSLLFKSTRQSTQIQANPFNQFYLLNAQGYNFFILCSLTAYFISILLSSNKVLFFKNFICKIQKQLYIAYNAFYFTKVQKLFMKFRNQYFSFGIFQINYFLLQFSTYDIKQRECYYWTCVNNIFQFINAFHNIIQNKRQTKMEILLSTFITSFLDCKLQVILNIQNYDLYISNLEAINYPEIQQILLSMSSVFYLGYLLNLNLQSINEFTKLILREIQIALNRVIVLILNKIIYYQQGGFKSAIFLFNVGLKFKCRFN
ncbi:unnamed protein product [Paramecium sonneborni]|uniref:Transmembrane protein n=1 Tax=Paramecium sonneborni TaxID=65129 RepID=A0A8S1RT27_9CILI|nr:unnamed protein product [Paramecium sonneborni]